MRNRNVVLLGISIFTLHFALGIHMCTWMNFLKEDLGISVQAVGVVESLREVPGLFSVVLVAIMLAFAHSQTAGVCLIVFSVGMAGYALVGGLASLIAVSVMWSIGFHVWLPFSDSMVLDTAPQGEEGAHVGRMRSIGFAAMFVGLLLVFVLGWLQRREYIAVPLYRLVYVLAGVVGVIGACASFGIDKDVGKAPPRKMIWRRRYGLYYWLMFLAGCRKQIFLTLAVMVLVRKYGAPVQHIAAMMILYNFTNWFGAPLLGRAIDRIGERPLLTFNYAGLTLVFVGYAVFQQWWVLYVLYCIDNLFNIFNIGLTTYLKRIADAEDIAPSLAMGVTANHLASVIVPLVACFIWEHVDYRISFGLGAAIAICSLISTQWVCAKKA